MATPLAHVQGDAENTIADSMELKKHSFDQLKQKEGYRRVSVGAVAALLMLLVFGVASSKDALTAGTGLRGHVGQRLLQAQWSEWAMQQLEDHARMLANGHSVQLHQSDFEHGTYRITNPGVYTLAEDVEFNPLPMSNSFAALNSTWYPMGGGYSLGFFAAISIEADGVVLDLGNHTLKQAPLHYLRQRFFAVVELASRPFVAEKGPPQFSAIDDPIVFGTNVVIENGVLGLSSHHGIHGNRNSNVFLKNLVIRDFEVGGVSLNGAEHVLVDNVDIGPSLGAEGSAQVSIPLATLSQARLIDHLFSGVINKTESLSILARSTKLSFRGENKVSVADVMQKLHKASEAFIKHSIHPEDENDVTSLVDGMNVFHNRYGLPDGSAVYGLLFHKTAPAVHEFGACNEEDLEGISGATAKQIVIRKVHIHHLKVRTDNVVMMATPEGTGIRGPAGDVVQIIRASSCGLYCRSLGNARYVGTVLSDAQLALQVLKNSAKNQLQFTDDTLFQYFGGTAIPDEIIQWAANPNAKLLQVLDSAPMPTPSPATDHNGACCPNQDDIVLACCATSCCPADSNVTLFCCGDDLAAPALWPQHGADHTKCRHWGVHVVEDRKACQAETVAAGHDLYQWHEKKRLCGTLKSCKFPITNTVGDWRVFKSPEYTLSCGGDAMAHVNKGAVGIRLEFLNGVSLSRVSVSDIQNLAPQAHPLCRPTAAVLGVSEYFGTDSRGIVISVSTGVELVENISVNSVRARRGRAYGVQLRTATGESKLKVDIADVQGLAGSMEISMLPDEHGSGKYAVEKYSS